MMGGCDDGKVLWMMFRYSMVYTCRICIRSEDVLVVLGYLVDQYLPANE